MDGALIYKSEYPGWNSCNRFWLYFVLNYQSRLSTTLGFSSDCCLIFFPTRILYLGFLHASLKKPKNSSEQASQRWRKLCWLVKNKKHRFRFTANLYNKFEVRAIQQSDLVYTYFFLLDFCVYLIFSSLLLYVSA